jgi:hypothetical protein
MGKGLGLDTVMYELTSGKASCGAACGLRLNLRVAAKPERMSIAGEFRHIGTESRKVPARLDGTVGRGKGTCEHTYEENLACSLAG